MTRGGYGSAVRDLAVVMLTLINKRAIFGTVTSMVFGATMGIVGSTDMTVAKHAGAVAWYATNVNRTGYSGPVLRVTRASDGNSADVRWDSVARTLKVLALGGGESLLTDWLGTSTASVSVWYDQSGNGLHATQTATASQPRVDAQLGCLAQTFARARVAARDTRNSKFMTLPVPLDRNAGCVMVRHGRSTTDTGGIVGTGPYQTSGRQYFLLRTASSGRYLWGNGSSDDRYFLGNDSFPGSIGTKTEVLLNYSNSPSTFGLNAYVNGVLQMSVNPYTGPDAATQGTAAQNATVGQTYGIHYFSGDLYALAIRRGVPMTAEELAVGPWLP